MANLIDIRRRIKSTKNTQQITKAMKMVSASRLRRASERATSARPYAERVLGVHRSILARMPEADGILYQSRPGKTLVIVLAGDKGLCGSFNSNIFKAVEAMIRKHGGENLVLLPVGKKAVAQFKKREDITVMPGYSGIFRDFSFALAEEMYQKAFVRFAEGEVGRVVLLFNKFRNVLVQDVTNWQVLPFDEESENADPGKGVEHLAEPSLAEILSDLTPKVVMTRIYQALLESCAAEHAARMTAMDAATNNAVDMIEKLTLEMNKARQAAITKELIEVVSGAAAL